MPIKHGAERDRLVAMLSAACRDEGADAIARMMLLAEVVRLSHAWTDEGREWAAMAAGQAAAGIWPLPWPCAPGALPEWVEVNALRLREDDVMMRNVARFAIHRAMQEGGSARAFRRARDEAATLLPTGTGRDDAKALAAAMRREMSRQAIKAKIGR